MHCHQKVADMGGQGNRIKADHQDHAHKMMMATTTNTARPPHHHSHQDDGDDDDDDADGGGDGDEIGDGHFHPKHRYVTNKIITSSASKPGRSSARDSSAATIIVVDIVKPSVLLSLPMR